MLDAAGVTAKVKELHEANTAKKTEDVIKILTVLKSEVEPTEELLKTSKAGVAIGKLRNSTSPGVSNLAKEVVKKWKEAIEQQKSKRKREDGDEVKKEDGGKKVKTEGLSATASPLPVTADNKGDAKPKKEDETPGASSSRRTSPKEEDGVLSTIDDSLKTARTAESDGVVKNLRVEGGDDTTRDKCAVMMYNALSIDSRAESRILKERAFAIEKAVFESHEGSTGNDYRAKIRSLFLNLKDKGNPGLRNKIVLGDVDAEKIVSMSKEDMASESVKAMNQKITENNLFKAKAVGETNAETDAFKCSRCQQRKCTYYQMQTRSADEPMTTFVTCTNCGNRWKFS